jgi:hypothetical protein
MKEKLLNIREAAQFLGISIDTLRRWDKSGKLVALKKTKGTHRYYPMKDLEMFSSDLVQLGTTWAHSGKEVSSDLYCSNSAVFQTRAMRMEGDLLVSQRPQKFVSLLTVIAGEIGNNSYDHNLGNWPDIPGVFFGYDIHKGVIVLADRGLGILKTLSRVKPSLSNHKEALRTAFTESISGRSPEKRGNGLKLVRKVVSKNLISLSFQTGDAELNIQRESEDLRITKAKSNIQGCFAVITF